MRSPFCDAGKGGSNRMKLQYKTRGMSDPKGKPKVYFSCHPEDFGEACELITEDLLNHANCAVF